MSELDKSFVPKSSLNPEHAGKLTDGVDLIPQQKKVDPIVDKPVAIKKKTLGDKFKETFVQDDAKTVGNYIFIDVVVPTIKDTIIDIVTKGINMLLWGGDRGYNRTNSRHRRAGSNIQGPQYTNYGSYSYNSFRDQQSYRSLDKYSRENHNFDTILFDTRSQARDVRDKLVDIIEAKNEATVADFYSLCRIRSEYTDEYYGWRELGVSRIRSYRDKFILVLPRPIYLKD